MTTKYTAKQQVARYGLRAFLSKLGIENAKGDVLLVESLDVWLEAVTFDEGSLKLWPQIRKD